MARQFYTSDQTPSLPGLPEITKEDHMLDQTTPLSDSYKTLKPESPVFINKLGSQIASSPALEELSSKIRTKTMNTYDEFFEKWDYYSGIAVSHWGMTIDRTKAIVSPNDQFLPNSLYVLSSTLLGSILARNRGLPLRFLSPWVFGAVSLNLAMPNTYNNIASSLGNKYLQVEEAKLPELKKAREESIEGLKQLTESSNSQIDSAWESLVTTVHNGREYVNDTIFSKKS